MCRSDRISLGRPGEDCRTRADPSVPLVARTGNSRRSVPNSSPPLPTPSLPSQYTNTTYIEIACAQTKPCAAFKHHFDECTERVLSGKTHIKGEDCVEELCTSFSVIRPIRGGFGDDFWEKGWLLIRLWTVHFMHCVDDCVRLLLLRCCGLITDTL